MLKFQLNLSCVYNVILSAVGCVSVSLHRARNQKAQPVVKVIGPGLCIDEVSIIRAASRS